jgi:glycine cleavage system H protein
LENYAMTILLVILMVTVLLLVDWYVTKRRQRITSAARAAQSAGELFLDSGHTWVRVHGNDLVSVGATDLASNFAGILSTVALPREGARLDKGDPAWALVSRKNRQLEQLMPIKGRVLAVNDSLHDNPDLTQRSPYEDGWILRVRPRDLERSLRDLLPFTAARSLIDEALSRITRRLSPNLGAVANDGGEWVRGFGERFEDAQWNVLRDELFPASRTRPPVE